MTTAYDLARKEIGVKETVGPKHNATVVKYFRDAGHPEIVDDETAWCAAFMGAMLARSGVKPTGSLAARSYLIWGEPVELRHAQPGDVVVFQRGSSSWQGHVGFYAGHDAKNISVLGGNQSNQVSVAKYPRSKLLGIRRASQRVTQPRIGDVALTVPGQADPPRSKKPGSGAGFGGIGWAVGVLFAGIAAYLADVGEWISNWFGG